MLRYVFKEMDGEWLVYYYYPEGILEAPGLVRVNRFKEGTIVSPSVKDFGGNLYAHHAIRGIDVTKEKGTVAWY